MRIACGGIQHETNTFANQPTTLEDFQRDSNCGPEFSDGDVIEGLYRGTGTIQGGFLTGGPRRGTGNCSRCSRRTRSPLVVSSSQRTSG